MTTATAVALAQAASHLPVAKATVDTGFASNGSSEPRSRSPAVASIATVIPPSSGARMANIGMRKSSTAPFCRGVAAFTRSTLTLSLSDGLTPRAMRRR